jgi:hypothetical protein
MIEALSRAVLKALAGLASLAAGVAFAQGAQLALLDRLDPGLWELRSRDGGAVERICVDDGRRLIQLRHAGLSCRQFVTEQAPDAVTVHYTCAGQGSARTHLRLESPRLVQIESSGVAGRLPFEVSAEARRVGSCSAREG